ncbi:hypothetical protein BDR22DRAFT_887597 [Usnea florida]
MTPIIQTLTILHYLSFAFAQPPNPNPNPLPLIQPAPNNLPNTSNATAPPDSIQCLTKPRPAYLLQPDCRYVLNEILLRQPNIDKPRIFTQHMYERDSGTYARSRWFYRTCQVEVHGTRQARQEISLLSVAHVASQIFDKCVSAFVIPLGGQSRIGDESKGFHVILQGSRESVSASNSSLPQSPATDVSKRAKRSPSNLENSVASQGVSTKQQPRDSSITLLHPTSATNATSSVTAAWSHPVHCFDARIAHLQEAVSSDCSHIANEIIYNLFPPYAQMTFGFTDAADINLSRPEYQKWQYGRCMVSLRNDDETQVDTFRLIDVVVTAVRINRKCVDDRWEMPLGGTASVGALEHGFYVYLGAPVAEISVSSDVTLSRRRIGLQS